MVLKNRLLITALLCVVLSGTQRAQAFEEDYATTYRATRDAYLKAVNEMKLATGPYKAAREAYVEATATYTNSLGSPDIIKTAHLNAEAKSRCLKTLENSIIEYRLGFMGY